MAASAPFQEAYESQRRRQYEALGTAMDAAARREAAKYGQAPLQPQRESIGSTIARSLAPAAGALTTGLIGGLFNRQPTAALPSTGGSFEPRAFTENWSFLPNPIETPITPNFSSAYTASGASFNPSLSFGFLN